MKRAACSAVILLSVYLMCSCINSVDSASTDEMAIIDENIELKDRISELEKELGHQNEKIKAEHAMQRSVVRFFHNINIGNIEEAKAYTTGNIKFINQSLMVLPHQRNVMIGEDAYMVLEFDSIEWEQPDEAYVMYTLLLEKRELKVKLYMVQEETNWKIDNIGFDYDL
ncbi:MAG: hypothetical protein ACI35R_01495 [Bacillus sp. (in: firmicutes)]